MSEELFGGNQTTNEEEVSQSQESFQQEQVNTEQQPPDTTQENNYFEIKYNKEPVKVSYDEAPTYIQKGMNYDKVQQRASEYENYLDRVAQLSGYQSHDEFIQALEDAERQQERQRYEEAGIDPDVFNELLNSHPDMQYAREMRAKEEQQQQFQSEAVELFDAFPDLRPDQIPDEVHQLRQERGLSLLDAYLRVNYQTLAQQKEQEAIQKLQNNVQSSPGSLGGGDVQHVKSVKNLSSKDFGSLVDQVLRGERKQL